MKNVCFPVNVARRLIQLVKYIKYSNENNI